MKKDMGLMIRQISHTFHAAMNQQMKNYHMTFSQAMVMRYLMDQPRCCAVQKELEQYAGVTHPTLIGILRRMESKGLLTVEVNPEDHRSRIVCISEKGKAIHHEMMAHKKEMDRVIFGHLTETEYATLEEILTKVTEQIDRN